MAGWDQPARVLVQYIDWLGTVDFRTGSVLGSVTEAVIRHAGKTPSRISSRHGGAPRTDKSGRRISGYTCGRDKDAIRYTIAHYYLTFSTIQMLLLVTLLREHDILLANLPSVAVAAVIYQLVGNRILLVSAMLPTIRPLPCLSQSMALSFY